MQMRILSRANIERVLTLSSVMDTVEQVYRIKAENKTVAWPTVFHDFKTGEQDMDIKSGYLRGMETHGLKVIDWTAVNEARGLPALVGLIMLFDTETGVPLGVLDGSYITGVRTGCAGAIGAKYLARRDSRSLFVLGTGGQAFFQTAAFLYAFPQLRRVYVADPRHGEKAELFVSTIRERLRAGFNIDASGVGFITAAADAMGEAVGSSDMIVTTTPSHSPIVKAGWIKSGTHLSCIGADMSGKQEIESTIFRNAVIIVPEPTPQAKVDKIKFYGGKVLLMGRDHDEAHRLGIKYIAENDLTYIDAYYDDPKIYGGQGTIALEILKQDPEIDTIVCPIGGSGLITGIAVAAKAVKPNIRIIGVQTEACPAMIAALATMCFTRNTPSPATRSATRW